MSNLSTARNVYGAIKEYLVPAHDPVDVLYEIVEVLLFERGADVAAQPPPTLSNLTAEQAFEQVAGENTPVKPQPPTARQRAEVRMGARPNAS